MTIHFLNGFTCIRHVPYNPEIRVVSGHMWLDWFEEHKHA
jgi:hypothetical protein